MYLCEKFVCNHCKITRINKNEVFVNDHKYYSEKRYETTTKFRDIAGLNNNNDNENDFQSDPNRLIRCSFLRNASCVQHTEDILLATSVVVDSIYHLRAGDAA